VIAIVDTGGANHASIQNAFTRIGTASVISSDIEVLERASHLILPGVGHAGAAMNRLKEQGLVEFLLEQKSPILGICLGLQILFESSEEGSVDGLGLLSGHVKKISARPDFRVPHMGWSKLDKVKESRLLNGLDSEAYFYFVHSYAAEKCQATTAMVSGGAEIPAVVEFENLYATQFHPERSGAAGSQLLKNFIAIAKEAS
jgi:imidazole glycerol-phosphate synthase subunit HisH